MCFTPPVSFATFAIEWILAFIVLSRINKNPKDKKIYLLGAVLLFLLGLYQFTEFMLCITNGIYFWATAGFLAYNFLPALALHLSLILTKAKTEKKHIFLIYIIPIVYSIYAIISPNFTASATCRPLFIYVERGWDPMTAWIYEAYYFLFILISTLIFSKAIKKAQTKHEKKILILGASGLLGFTIPTLILLLILPDLGIIFPSVYCHFAIIYAILLFYLIRQIEKK